MPARSASCATTCAATGCPMRRPAPYSIDDHVGDLAALLDAHGIRWRDRHRAVGRRHDRPSSRRRAARLVRLLVLCDTAHKIGTPEMWNARIDAVRASGLASIADAVLERWFSVEFRQARAADLAGYRNMLTRNPAEGYIGTCATLRDTDLTSAASRLTQPTLCLVGEEDGATPPALVRSLSELIPNAAFETIPNAGHLPCIEQPELAGVADRIPLSGETGVPSQSQARPVRAGHGDAPRRPGRCACRRRRSQARPSSMRRSRP